MSRRSLTFTAVVALVAALAVVPIAVAKGGGTETRIALRASSHFPSASGKATFRVDGSQRRLEVEVEHVRRLAGRRVNVFVNGSRIGSPRVNRFGHATLERESERGQSVPRIRHGSTVRVRTRAGTLVVSGRF